MPRMTTRFTLAATAAAALAFAAITAPAQAGTLKWITSKTQNAGDAQQLSMSWMVEQFKIRTGGKEDIQVFWGGSVAKDKEIPDFISGGAADMGDIITPYFPDKFPLNNAVGYFIPQPHSTIEIAETDGILAPHLSAIRRRNWRNTISRSSGSGRWKTTA